MIAESDAVCEYSDKLERKINTGRMNILSTGFQEKVIYLGN
jgi:hypothetical protein